MKINVAPSGATAQGLSIKDERNPIPKVVNKFLLLIFLIVLSILLLKCCVPKLPLENKVKTPSAINKIADEIINIGFWIANWRLIENKSIINPIIAYEVMKPKP